MILTAKYLGPYPEVTVPGFAGKTALIGETHKVRVPDGHPLTGAWEITEGLDAYNQALEKMAQDTAANMAARVKRQAEFQDKVKRAVPDESAHYLAAGEADHSEPVAKAAKKSGGLK